jgi:hypothetical protein
MPSTATAVEFLRCLQPDGPWLLVAIHPFLDVRAGKIARVAFYPGQERELHEWIDSLQGDRNLYYTSNLLSHAPFNTHVKDAVTALRLLHVDVDLPGPADDVEAVEALEEKVLSLDPPPTAVVFTGGGYQAVWRFRASVEATALSILRVEAANTVIWQKLNGDPCHDVSRLLRLPGTVNVPDQKKLSRGRLPRDSRLV